jgi:hypothetical protein
MPERAGFGNGVHVEVGIAEMKVAEDVELKEQAIGSVQRESPLGGKRQELATLCIMSLGDGGILGQAEGRVGDLAQHRLS